MGCNCKSDNKELLVNEENKKVNLKKYFKILIMMLFILAISPIILIIIWYYCFKSMFDGDVDFLTRKVFEFIEQNKNKKLGDDYVYDGEINPDDYELLHVETKN